MRSDREREERRQGTLPKIEFLSMMRTQATGHFDVPESSVTAETEEGMSQTAIIVQGIVMPDGTLQLDEKLNVPPGRVQVVVQPLPDLSSDPFWLRHASHLGGPGGPRTRPSQRGSG